MSDHKIVNVLARTGPLIEIKISDALVENNLS